VDRRSPAPALFPSTTLFRSPSCRQRWAPGPRPRAPHARLVSLHRLPFPRMSLRSWSIALLLLLPGALCATDPPPWTVGVRGLGRSEEHTSELQSRENLVCRP